MREKELKITAKLRQDQKALSAKGMMEQFVRRFSVPPPSSEQEVQRVKKRVHETIDLYNSRMLTPLTWQQARKDNIVPGE